MIFIINQTTVDTSKQIILHYWHIPLDLHLQSGTMEVYIYIMETKMARLKDPKDLKGPRKLCIVFPWPDLLKQMKSRAALREIPLPDWIREVCKENIQREDLFRD